MWWARGEQTNSEVSCKQHSCGSRSNSASKGVMLGRIWFKDSTCPVPGHVGRQHGAITGAWYLESQAEALALLPINPFISELHILCMMKFLGWRISPGTPDWCTSAVFCRSWEARAPSTIPQIPRRHEGLWRMGQLDYGNQPCTVGRDLGSYQLPLCVYSGYLFVR